MNVSKTDLLKMEEKKQIPKISATNVDKSNSVQPQAKRSSALELSPTMVVINSGSKAHGHHSRKNSDSNKIGKETDDGDVLTNVDAPNDSQITPPNLKKGAD